MKKTKKGFTLVELLAVIVILAIILVIAVPQIMNTIKESRKGALASSAKLIASTAESKRTANEALEITEEISCSDVAQINSEDYESCTLEFDSNGKAQVTIVGKGKFEGLYVCSGTKESAEATEEACTGSPGGSTVETISFEEDSWANIKAAVEAGDTENYNVGDTKTVDLGDLGEHTVRIANKTACDGTLSSETACGFVIEFADVVSGHVMNANNTNFGGWPASDMRKYLNDLDPNDSTDGVIYNALVSAIGDIIIDTKVVSGHGSGDTTGTLENNNFESTDKVYLFSTSEVYGKENTGDPMASDTASGNEITRQLDYYKDNNVSTSNYSGAIKQYAGGTGTWWLRSADSNNTTIFFMLDTNGSWVYCDASLPVGFSPAFRLG